MGVCARAPAKVILFGEHFVVLGRPAIVTAVDVYARVCVNKHKGSAIIESKNLRVTLDSTREPRELAPYKRIMEELGVYKGFHAVIDSDIPVGAGMGSSAATAVAFTAALSRFAGISLSLDEISRIAFKAEEIVHGKPSGIDNTIATYGGFLLYRKGRFRKIDVAWPGEYALVIADTGIERSTRKAVQQVLSLYKRRENIMKHIYDAAEAIVDSAVEALEAGDIEALGELMRMNHGLLVSIGVAILETEEIVHRAIRAGALGAKITGAGLGGCVVVLAKRNTVKEVANSISDYAKRILVVRPISKGVELYESA